MIPESHKDLLQDETKALAFLATTMPDGSPQVTPLWFNVEGEHILINSAEGRVKDRNMVARPEVALVIMALDKPYRYIQIRGRVVEITQEGAEAHINTLSQKYRGRDWDYTAGQVRKIYKIEPHKVSVME
jgi:PPOX class probable F420-dependent enzyme